MRIGIEGSGSGNVRDELCVMDMIHTLALHGVGCAMNVILENITESRQTAAFIIKSYSIVGGYLTVASERRARTVPKSHEYISPQEHK